MLGSPYFSFVAYIMKVLEFLVVRIIPTDVVGMSRKCSLWFSYLLLFGPESRRGEIFVHVLGDVIEER